MGDDGGMASSVDGNLPAAVAVRGPSPAVTRRSGLRSSWRPAVRNTVLVAVSLVLWGISLPAVALGRIDGWGLLPALPVTWYLAYALCLGVVVSSFSSRREHSRVDRVVSLAGLMLMLFATTSLVYDAPRYPWTYKHIGITQYLLLHHRPDLSLDIYQNFPGFFYLAAVAHLVTRVPVIGLARWSEVFFSAANAVAAYWALGALARSTRVRAVAVLLLTLTNWIGQAYFSPQSLVFPLSLLVIGMLLRRAGGPGEVTAWRPASRPGRGSDPRWSGRRGWRGVLWLLLFNALFAVIVVTHQLTPISTLIQLGVLVVLLRFRDLWLIPGLVALEGLWIWHAYPFISAHYVLFGGASADNIRPPADALPAVLPGSALIADVPHLITALVAVGTVGAVAVLARRERSVRSSLIPLALAAAPAALLVVQPYGQEGILRVYLYALPWLCLIISKALVGGPSDRRGPAGRLGLVAVLAVLGAIAVPETFGFELINHVPRSDVDTEDWFDVSTPPGSVLVHLVPDYPDRASAHYDAHFVPNNPDGPVLQDDPGFVAAARSAVALEAFAVAQLAARPAASPSYLAIGPTQTAYLRLYGLTDATRYPRFVRRLEHDPRLTLVRRDGPSMIFRYRAAVPGATAVS